MALWTLKIVISVIYVSALLLENCLRYFLEILFICTYISMIWCAEYKNHNPELPAFCGHCKWWSQSYICALSITLKWFQRFSWSLPKMSSKIRWHVELTNHMSCLIIFLSYRSLNIENNSFCDILVNFTRIWSTMRGSAEKESCKSSLLAFWNVALWTLKIVISVICSCQLYLGKGLCTFSWFHFWQSHSICLV